MPSSSLSQGRHRNQVIFPMARQAGDVRSQAKNLGTALVVQREFAKPRLTGREVLHPAPPPPNGAVKAPLHTHSALALSPRSHTKQQDLSAGREGEAPWQGVQTWSRKLGGRRGNIMHAAVSTGVFVASPHSCQEGELSASNA